MQERYIAFSGAVYRVLDTLPDNDPLKNRAKEKVLALLDVFQAGANGYSQELASQITSDLASLEHYLQLAKYQGWISDMNFLILKKELDVIKNDIKPATRQISKVTQTLTIQSPKLPEKEKPVMADPKDYSSRQVKILDILAKNQKAQVADLIKSLPNVTKRTIRRDLIDLLERKKIVRVGEFNQVFYALNPEMPR